MTEITARAITAVLRKRFPDARLSTAAGAHPGEFRVRLPESAHRDIGAPWGLASLLHRELGVVLGVDGVRWLAPRKGVDRAAESWLHTVRGTVLWTGSTGGSTPPSPPPAATTAG
jgi:hypothetical protein